MSAVDGFHTAVLRQHPQDADDGPGSPSPTSATGLMLFGKPAPLLFAEDEWCFAQHPCVCGGHDSSDGERPNSAISAPELPETEVLLEPEPLPVREELLDTKKLPLCEEVAVPEELPVREKLLEPEKKLLSEELSVPQELLDTKKLPLCEEVAVPEELPVREKLLEPEKKLLSEELSVPQELPVRQELLDTKKLPLCEEVAVPEELPVREELLEPEKKLLSEELSVPQELLDTKKLTLCEEMVVPDELPAREELLQFKKLTLCEEMAVLDELIVRQEPLLSKKLALCEEIAVPEELPVRQELLLFKKLTLGEEMAVPDELPAREELLQYKKLTLCEEMALPYELPVREKLLEPEKMLFSEELSVSVEQAAPVLPSCVSGGTFATADEVAADGVPAPASPGLQLCATDVVLWSSLSCVSAGCSAAPGGLDAAAASSPSPVLDLLTGAEDERQGAHTEPLNVELLVCSPASDAAPATTSTKDSGSAETAALVNLLREFLPRTEDVVEEPPLSAALTSVEELESSPFVRIQIDPEEPSVTTSSAFEREAGSLVALEDVSSTSFDELEAGPIVADEEVPEEPSEKVKTSPASSEVGADPLVGLEERLPIVDLTNFDVEAFPFTLLEDVPKESPAATLPSTLEVKADPVVKLEVIPEEPPLPTDPAALEMGAGHDDFPADARTRQPQRVWFAINAELDELCAAFPSAAGFADSEDVAAGDGAAALPGAPDPEVVVDMVETPLAAARETESPLRSEDVITSVANTFSPGPLKLDVDLGVTDSQERVKSLVDVARAATPLSTDASNRKGESPPPALVDVGECDNHLQTGPPRFMEGNFGAVVATLQVASAPQSPRQQGEDGRPGARVVGDGSGGASGNSSATNTPARSPATSAVSSPTAPGDAPPAQDSRAELHSPEALEDGGMAEDWHPDNKFRSRIESLFRMDLKIQRLVLDLKRQEQAGRAGRPCQDGYKESLVAQIAEAKDCYRHTAFYLLHFSGPGVDGVGEGGRSPRKGGRRGRKMKSYRERKKAKQEKEEELNRSASPARRGARGQLARSSDAGGRSRDAGTRNGDTGARRRDAGARSNGTGARRRDAGARSRDADARSSHTDDRSGDNGARSRNADARSSHTDDESGVAGVRGNDMGALSRRPEAARGAAASADDRDGAGASGLTSPRRGAAQVQAREGRRGGGDADADEYTRGAQKMLKLRSEIESLRRELVIEQVRLEGPSEQSNAAIRSIQGKLKRLERDYARVEQQQQAILNRSAGVAERRESSSSEACPLPAGKPWPRKRSSKRRSFFSLERFCRQLESVLHSLEGKIALTRQRLRDLGPDDQLEGMELSESKVLQLDLQALIREYNSVEARMRKKIDGASEYF